MRILLAQINLTVGDIKRNLSKILLEIQKGKEKNVDLVVFPEMAISGYPPEDLLLLENFIDELEKALKIIIENTKGIACVIGTVRRNLREGEKKLYNTAAVIEDGKLLGYQDKTLLPTYDLFDERRFFTAASENHLWKIKGKKIGVTICEDIWGSSGLLKCTAYDKDPVSVLALLNPDFVINLSASPYNKGKISDRLRVCSLAAIKMKTPLLLCNQVGGNEGLIFDGSSFYVDEKGFLIDYAKSFEEESFFVDLFKNNEKKEIYIDDNELLYKALVLGLRDYFHKLGFKKAILGLSGGIDSALVACLAVEALGKSNVIGLMMPSRYSSEGSLFDAEHLAKNLEIETSLISIENIFQGYLNELTPVLGDIIDTLTSENIQARIRGMLLMSLSNQSGALVLCTGNKSEQALGYSTLYGDTCGSVSVIGDLTKRLVFSLSSWINRKQEIIPWNTINKAPSAELRFNQKDSDSLPEYQIIDNIISAYIEENLTAESIAKMYSYSLEIVQEIIQKINRNEYKRRQSPLSFRVSKKAFSVGRRFPIVQQYET